MNLVNVLHLVQCNNQGWALNIWKRTTILRLLLWKFRVPYVLPLCHSQRSNHFGKLLPRWLLNITCHFLWLVRRWFKIRTQHFIEPNRNDQRMDFFKKCQKTHKLKPNLLVRYGGALEYSVRFFVWAWSKIKRSSKNWIYYKMNCYGIFLLKSSGKKLKIYAHFWSYLRAWHFISQRQRLPWQAKGNLKCTMECCKCS